AVLVLRLVQDEVGVSTPSGEQAVFEPGAGHPLEVDGGDDLVGVHVAVAQRNRTAGVDSELLHGDVSSTVAGGLQVGGRGQRAAHRGGGGDQRRHQVGAAALALPALEVAVGGGGAALPGLERVGVHAQAH